MFYRKLRAAGMVAAAIGTTLLTTSHLPLLQEAGNWLAAAGSAAAAVSQTTVSPRRKTKKEVIYGRKRSLEI